MSASSAVVSKSSWPKASTGFFSLQRTPWTSLPSSPKGSRGYQPAKSLVPAPSLTPSVFATFSAKDLTWIRAPSMQPSSANTETLRLRCGWSAAQVAGVPLALYPGVDTLPSQEQLLISVRHAGAEVASLKG